MARRLADAPALWQAPEFGPSGAAVLSFAGRRPPPMRPAIEMEIADADRCEEGAAGADEEGQEAVQARLLTSSTTTGISASQIIAGRFEDSSRRIRMGMTREQFVSLVPGDLVYRKGEKFMVMRILPEKDFMVLIGPGTLPLTRRKFDEFSLEPNSAMPSPEVNIALSRMGPMMLRGSASNWQQAVMLYDPATGAERPYPSHAAQWRQYHGKTAWLYNPWTGKPRDARDIGTDVMGMLVSADASSPSQATAATDNIDAIKDAIKDSHEIPAFLRRGTD